jgi:hypothetical protein
MNRRGFLGTLFGGVAATAAVRTWPFRVFSFPTEIVKPELLTNIRLIRGFDPAQMKMVSRWDVLYGFANLENNANLRLRLTNVDGQVIEKLHPRHEVIPFEWADLATESPRDTLTVQPVKVTPIV